MLMGSIFKIFGGLVRGLEAAGASIGCLGYHLGIPGEAMVPQNVLNGSATPIGALFCWKPRQPHWRAMGFKIYPNWVVR